MSDLAKEEGAGAVSEACALVAAGDELFDAGRHDDAFAAWDEVIEQFGSVTDAEIRRCVVRALVGKAYNLSKLDRAEEAIAVYDDLAARFHAGEAARVAEIVAQGLLNRALALGRLERRAEELEAYDDLVDRYGDAQDPGTRRRVAWALYNKAVTLNTLQREVEAVAVYDELSARVGGDGEAVRVAEVVAKGLLNRALVFRRLKRRAEELESYDDLVERYGDSNDPQTRRHVAWALFDKAVTLRETERVDEALAAFDDLITRFGSVNEKDVRPLVSWALWNKSRVLDTLGRSDERTPLYSELIARGDEKLDPSLREVVIWCLWETQKALDLNGERDAQLEVLDQLISRFLDSSDEDQRRTVINTFGTKAYVLGQLGRAEDEVATYDELLAHFGGSSEPAIALVLADNLRRKARALDRLSRLDEALTAYDEALSVLDSVDGQDRAPLVINILCDKAKTLCDAGRDDEAVVVVDSTVTTYLNELPIGSRTSHTTATAVLALFYKVRALATRGHHGATELVCGQLLEVLGDVCESPPTTRDAGSASAEAELAALLAEVHHGDCWLWLATADNDPSSRELMTERALDLYRRTEPWLTAHVETWDEPRSAAALLLRNIADGFAILSRWWSDRERVTLPLPTRPLMEWAIRLAGIDDWAAEQGHPLDLRESTEAVDSMLDEQRTTMLEQEGAGHPGAEDMASAFVVAARLYELFRILVNSPTGREAVRDWRIGVFAAWHVSNARAWAGWVRDRVDEAAGAAAAMVLMAQALFVASHGGATSSTQLFPNTVTLNELISQLDGFEWLSRHEAQLPNWLTHDES